jgi:hypothetical protein
VTADWPRPPTGAGATLADWTDWRAQVIGLRPHACYAGFISIGPAQLPARAYSPPDPQDPALAP